MTKKILSLVLVLALGLSAFAITGCTGENEGSDGSSNNNLKDYDASWVDTSIAPEEIGSSIGLENFNTIDLYGNHADQSIFADYKITVVDVWGTYCNPCINAMPTLAKMYDEYEPQGVNFLGLIIDVQNTEFIPQKDLIIKAMEITDMTGADFQHILLSENIAYSVLTDISAIPASFIVDSEGNMLTGITYGGHGEDQWREILDDYIKED